MSIFKNKRVLITGGTGSFGNAILPRLIEGGAAKVIVFSRDEMKQWEMAQRYNQNVGYFIGDVRDKDRLLQAFRGVDIVIHAAATKIVPTAEYNPFECIKTNIHGAMNVIEAAIDRKVSKVIALSTDKASSPINLYGATKLISDKVFVAANASYAGGLETTFSVVRYGNVLGSRGSIIPLFLKQKERGSLTITDPSMTRFILTLNQGIDLVETALETMIGGEIYVKKIPSMEIGKIAKVIAPKASWEIIGIRPGEKMHEQMISSEEASFTYEFEDHYRILPQIHDWYLDPTRISSGRRVPHNFSYASNTNSQWLDESKFMKLLEKT
tara:strand:- start:302 stop:1279 length:978 start_codon:yes stop_codon:yes gene_type:complete